VKAIAVILCLGVAGCGTLPSVRPIGKGKESITLSTGGPVTVIYDITMPVPYAVLRYRRGLTEDRDFHAGIHPTMLLFGNLGIDAGLTKHVMHQAGWKPSLCLEGSIYGFYHAHEFSSIRAYPEFSVVGSYRRGGGGQILYFGIQNMMQLSRPYLVSAPLVGLELPFGSRFVLNSEAKWYGPVEQSDRRSVDYSYRPLGQGAIGFVFGGSYKF